MDKIWIKNVLKTEISQLIVYHKYKKEAILRIILQEINDPIYQNFYDIDSSDKFWESSFVKAIKDKNNVAIYDICKWEVYKHMPKILLKKIAFKILNTIWRIIYFPWLIYIFWPIMKLNYEDTRMSKYDRNT